MFKKLFQKLKSAFTLKHACLLLVPVLMVLVVPEIAHAAAPPDAQTETYTKIGSVLTIVLNVIQSLLWPFLLFIGDLMDVDMITGPGMEERLWAIWVQMRDLVNICFVIFLLVIAFYNTLGIGGGEGNLAMKTALPKVVLGLILVNFTFVGGKLVIDVSNVATTAVFALPELVTDFDMDKQRGDMAKNLCSKNGATYDYESEDTPVLTRIFCKVNEEETEYLQELSLKSEQEYFIRMNKSNIALVMATNMGAINSQLELDSNITSLGELLENLTFSVIMSLVFAVAYIALGLVLLARVVVLWLVLAFSPIGVLIFVIPQLKDMLGGGDIVQKIVKHLMAPIIIGICLTVGYIMIDAYDGVVSGSAGIGGAEANALLASEVLFSGVSDIAQLIISVASVVVVWVGVFSASSDTLAGFATNGLKGLGEMAGKNLAKMPLQAASMPVPIFNKDTGKMEKSSINGLDMIQGVRNRLGNHQAKQRENQNTKLVNAFGAGFGNQGGRFNSTKEKLTDLNRVTADGKLTNSEFDRIKREFSEIAQNNRVSNQGGLQSQLNQKIEDVKANRITPSQLSTWIRGKADAYGIEDKDDKEALNKFADRLSRADYEKPDTTPPANPGTPAPAVGGANNGSAVAAGGAEVSTTDDSTNTSGTNNGTANPTPATGTVTAEPAAQAAPPAAPSAAPTAQQAATPATTTSVADPAESPADSPE